jgi:hypothetical protein
MFFLKDWFHVSLWPGGEYRTHFAIMAHSKLLSTVAVLNISVQETGGFPPKFAQQT